MKYLKLFEEHNNNIVGYYFNEDEHDEDVPEDLHDKAYKLAYNRGIRISSSKDLLYVFYDTIIEKVIGAVFRDSIGKYSFDIVVDSGYERTGIETKLVKIAIDDYEMQKEYDEDLEMEIDCINPVMSDILRRKFGFKDGAVLGPDRIIMTKKL
jgi:ribosomal protein S18 acetylase RimI-like enzyme